MIVRAELFHKAQKIACEVVKFTSALPEDTYAKLLERHGDDETAALKELVRLYLKEAAQGVNDFFEAEDYWSE